MLKHCMIILLSTALSAPAFAGGWGGGYRHGYGGHYGGHFGARYHHHGGGDAGAALLAGLVIGGLVGWAVNEDRHYYRNDVYRPEPYPRYREYGYYEPEYREYVRVVPRTRVITVPVESEFAGHACRMTREYTTTIEIDGAQRDAYGTKCLTADGSWVLGRPKLVPEFN